ncbi:MAG: hypothetical protein NT069_18050, partial [Planctomycetota bacterium]|nr:hypothetical protein [Planctomycetota bacterium]
TLRADAAERWRQLARQLSPELRAETLEAIFNAHGEDYAGIWKTEVLNLGSDAARFVPAQEIQAARDWHAAGEALIGPAKPSDPELRPDFFQRVQGWYSYAGVQT